MVTGSSVLIDNAKECEKSVVASLRVPLGVNVVYDASEGTAAAFIVAAKAINTPTSNLIFPLFSPFV